MQVQSSSMSGTACLGGDEVAVTLSAPETPLPNRQHGCCHIHWPTYSPSSSEANNKCPDNLFPRPPSALQHHRASDQAASMCCSVSLLSPPLTTAHTPSYFPHCGVSSTNSIPFPIPRTSTHLVQTDIHIPLLPTPILALPVPNHHPNSDLPHTSTSLTQIPTTLTAIAAQKHHYQFTGITPPLFESSDPQVTVASKSPLPPCHNSFTNSILKITPPIIKSPSSFSNRVIHVQNPHEILLPNINKFHWSCISVSLSPFSIIQPAYEKATICLIVQRCSQTLVFRTLSITSIAHPCWCILLLSYLTSLPLIASTNYQSQQLALCSHHHTTATQLLAQLHLIIIQHRFETASSSYLSSSADNIMDSFSTPVFARRFKRDMRINLIAKMDPVFSQHSLHVTTSLVLIPFTRRLNRPSTALFDRIRSFKTATMDNMLFCGWNNNDKYDFSIDQADFDTDNQFPAILRSAIPQPKPTPKRTHQQQTLACSIKQRPQPLEMTTQMDPHNKGDRSSCTVEASNRLCRSMMQHLRQKKDHKQQELTHYSPVTMYPKHAADSRLNNMHHCPFCCIPFLMMSQLRQHMRIHTQNKSTHMLASYRAAMESI